MVLEVPAVNVVDAVKEVQDQPAAETSGAFVQHRLKDVSEKERLELSEKAEIIMMRKSWSRWILFVIIFITFIDVLIIILVGFELIHFESELALPAIITESIVKVIGLAYIIVNFLFNKDSLGTK